MLIRTDEVGVLELVESRHESVLGLQLKQAPIDFGEPDQQAAQFEVIAGHDTHLGQQFLANVFGHGLLVEFGGQMPAALGRAFVERTLEEVEGGLDLLLELFLA